MNITEQLENSAWRLVPALIEQYTKEAAGPYQVMSDLLESMPSLGGFLWYNPERHEAMFSYPEEQDSEKVAAWHVALSHVPGVDAITHSPGQLPNPDEPYMQVKTALQNKDVFGPVSSALNLKPNWLNNLWGGPNPLAATLSGALLGAGLGYGGGWLAEQLLPEEYFKSRNLRRTMALIGGLGGAVPGAAMALGNYRHHPNENVRGDLLKSVVSRPFYLKEARVALYDALPAEFHTELDESLQKVADDAGGLLNANIPVDQFNRVVWNDLRGTGGFTPPAIAAATTGITQAASLSRGGVNFISPADIARIGIGAGSGYLSGLAVGKTLGALAGLRPGAQQTLQRTGLWAGVLANTVPLLF